MNTREMIQALVKTGLTQRAVAKHAGVSESIVCRILKGHKPGFNVAHSVAKVYEAQYPAWQIGELGRSLAVMQGNFEEARLHIDELNKRIDELQTRNCLWCRVKAYFKGEK